MVTEISTLAILVLFTWSDLKYRVVPAIEFFFFGSVLMSVSGADLLRVAVVVMAVAYGILSVIPDALAAVLLFNPVAWPSLLISYGVRRDLFGRADLFAIGGISLIFPLEVTIAAIIGTVIWAKWWLRRGKNFPVPLLPGMFLGVLIGLAFRFFLNLWI